MASSKQAPGQQRVALKLLATAPRIRSMVTRFLRDSDEHLEMNIQEFDLIRHTEGTEIRMSDLAALMSLTPSAVTKIVDGVVLKRLVQRFEDPQDRRVNRLRLTKTGRGKLAVVRSAVSAHLTHLTKLLPGDELANLSHGLDSLLKAMDAQVSSRE